MKSLNHTIASAAVAVALVLPLAASAYSGPVELSAGSMVTSKMNSTIDSGSARVGDKFSMTVLTPYPGNNGAYTNGQLYGHVTSVTAAGQGRNPVLAFNIDRIVLTNGRHASVSMFVQSQETQRHNNMANVAITALGGMFVGNMIGKTVFKSNLGGPAGLIAGVLYASNKKTNVSLRQGSVVVTEVRRSVALLSSGTVAQAVSH
jgi:hypothetical protein